MELKQRVAVIGIQTAADLEEFFVFEDTDSRKRGNCTI